jgi:hypothetical protein
MARSGSRTSVWALELDRELSREEAESALGAAKIGKGESVEAGGSIERIDVSEGTTTIFVSGSRGVAERLADRARKQVRGGKVTLSRTTPAELRRPR